MAKRPPKDKWLGGRAEGVLFTEVNEYIEVTGMTMGELVRASVREFMWSHPKLRKEDDNPDTQKTIPQTVND